MNESPSSIAFDLSEEWLFLPTHGSLRQWLDDVGDVAPAHDGIISVRLSTELWTAAAMLPPEGASEEELDIWRSRHELLAQLGDVRTQRLDIGTVGHVGARGFELTCRLDGAAIEARGASARAHVGERSVLLLPAMLEALRLAAHIQPNMDRGAQLAALGTVKSYAERANALLADCVVRAEITFDEHLDAIRFVNVDRAALSWSASRAGVYDMTLEVREEQGEGYRRLPVGELDPNAPLISVSGKEHLLLSDEVATVARIAKKNRNKLRRQVADALADPKKVLPPGETFDRIDLSRYSPRVAGFAPVVRADRPIDVRASGTVWYEDDEGGPFLRLEVAQADGASTALTFDTPADVRNFLATSAKDAGGVVRVGDVDVVPTEPLLERAREALSMHEKREAEEQPRERPSPENAQPKTRLVALIKDADESSPLSEAGNVDVSSVPWSIIESLLLPSITLKPHQRDGIAWLFHHHKRNAAGVLLADDMGLGKTLQIAAFLALVQASRASTDKLPSLIVAPVILLENWHRELRKFFKPEVFASLLVLHGSELRVRVSSAGLDISDLSRFAWVLTNYETLARYQQQLLALDFDVVVLDEAQAVKNPDAVRTRAVRGLKRRFAICSTGTPVENRLLDLWTLYDILSPGRPFAAREEFERNYESDVGSGVTAIRTALRLPSRSSTLLRRTKAEALSSLPEKKEIIVPIAMTEEQVALERSVTSGRGSRVLETLHKLQKLYQHPRLLKRASGVEQHEFSIDDIIAESPKLSKVIDILTDVKAKGEKAIVFTIWTAMQHLLSDVLKARLDLRAVPIINGDTNARGRAQDVLDEFSATPGFAVLVLSPLAAGTGLTITAANHVIHYGRWWNPAKEDQATDRAYRIGQTKPVFVHYPVLHHPGKVDRGFDVKLHGLVSKKRTMARDFLDPTRHEEITQSELDALGAT